ncbi:MAG TPA: hypothetical protein VKG22_10210 [Stellaceae bacterium]|nr:hypothetical protein [Stellaceae bacterium]
MPRVRDGRLARLTAESTRLDSTAGLDDCTLRAWNTVRAVVCDGLLRAGIDPACAIALKLGESAIDMADLGDRHELGRREEELAAGDHDGLAGIFSARIGDVVRRFRDGHEPDFGSASLAELFAWCLSRRGSCRG